MTTKITSAGIIRNAEAPRVGVVNVGSLSEWIFETIDRGIDIAWEEACEDFQAELRAEGIKEDSQEWECRMQDFSDESDSFGTKIILFGNWEKDAGSGFAKYVPDTSGEYAASFNSDSNVVTVEWSKYTTPTHHTSPCYVMADGSGPCGDLDTPGDSVIAYTLPPEFFDKGG